MGNWINTAAYARHEKRVGIYGNVFALSLFLITFGGMAGDRYEGFLYIMAAGMMLFLLLVPVCMTEIFVVLLSLSKHNRGERRAIRA